MTVDWKIENGESPVVFSRLTAWENFTLRHYRIKPGVAREFALAEHEINIPLGGNAMLVGRQTATGKQNIGRRSTVGNVCLVPAGQPVAASWDEEIECLCIRLAPALLAPHNERIELIEIYDAHDDLIRQIGFALLNEAQNGGNRLYAESLAQTLSLHLRRNYAANAVKIEKFNGGLSGSRLRRVSEFINENLERDLSLAEIAEIAGLSLYHFARAFKTTTNQTPQQYLMRQRVELAKSLLKNSDLPLVEISARAGFKNQSHFTTLFRKFTRTTPKNWRESHGL